MPAQKKSAARSRAIKSTQKITKAMEMVAASKMRKAQDRMRAARPVRGEDPHRDRPPAPREPGLPHPFLVEREPKSVGIIVISTDRGLCGSLNINVFKPRSRDPRVAGQGRGGAALHHRLQGLAFFKRLKVPIARERHAPRRPPHVADLIGTVKVMLDAYARASSIACSS
jgi:F-type H+-transporting ATPase subunit gamma